VKVRRGQVSRVVLWGGSDSGDYEMAKNNGHEFQ
jgi:hypothetical protein